MSAFFQSQAVSAHAMWVMSRCVRTCSASRSEPYTSPADVTWSGFSNWQTATPLNKTKKKTPVRWQQHCDGEELINYGTFLHEGGWYSCTKSTCEQGVSVWNAVHWKNKLGLKQRGHKCGWIDGLHVCLAGRGVASETSGEKCCLTFSTVGKVYCHFMPSGMTPQNKSRHAPRIDPAFGR